MKTTDLLQNALTAVLTICAVVVTGLLVRREFAGPAETGPPAIRETVRDWQAYDDGRHRVGPEEAVVTIVEFSDFQCPFCRVAAGKLDSLRDEYPRDVAVVYRHFPMPQHRHAVAAAQASECAGAQGRFWQMHDALYTKQDSIGVVGWTRFASDAGVGDLAAFETCLRDDAPGAIRSDTRAARRLKVNGTPTLLINEHRVVGVQPLDTLRAYVREALEGRSE
jgi:protein-disulfide isomerase